MAKNRNYSYKDVDMLMAAKTIAESFKVNISELSTTRTVWTEQYADDLIARIDSAMENHLGIDIKKLLRDATASLVAIQIPAKRDLSYFKTQIDDDFKKDSSKKKEILKNTWLFKTPKRCPVR
jgi:flagellar biosynthesis regulator FlaF